MPNLITAKIDLKKVIEEHLFNANSGAQYLDIVLIPSKNSQYGDTHFIVQGVNKASRDKGVKGPIIGNAKEKMEGVQPDAGEERRAPASRHTPPQRNATSERQSANMTDDPLEDVPFAPPNW